MFTSVSRQERAERRHIRFCKVVPRTHGGANTTRVDVVGRCVVTGEEHAVKDLPAGGVRKFREGEPLSRCFTRISSGDLEFLISGVSPEGWKRRWGLE